MCRLALLEAGTPVHSNHTQTLGFLFIRALAVSTVKYDCIKRTLPIITYKSKCVILHYIAIKKISLDSKNIDQSFLYAKNCYCDLYWE